MLAICNRNYFLNVVPAASIMRYGVSAVVFVVVVGLGR
jgi:hypothetical protein